MLGIPAFIRGPASLLQLFQERHLSLRILFIHLLSQLLHRILHDAQDREERSTPQAARVLRLALQGPRRDLFGFGPREVLPASIPLYRLPEMGIQP